MEQTFSPRQAPRYLIPIRYATGRWQVFLFLTLMMMSVAWAIAAAQWAEGLYILPQAAAGGLLLSTALAFSRWRGAFPWLHGLLSGVLWVGYLAGRLLPGDLTLQQRYYEITNRLYFWGQRLVNEQPANDNLVFVAQLAFILWWLAFFSAWAIFRQGRAWPAVLPSGLILLVNVYYAGQDLTIYLILFTLFALLLIMRTYLSQQEQNWRYSRVQYDSTIGFDFLRDGLVFSVIIVGLAWTLPNLVMAQKPDISIAPIRRAWDNLQEEWARVFSSLNYESGGGVGVISSELAFGGPRNLGDNIVMDVVAPAGRYWRASTFDTYTGQGWINTDEEAINVDEDDVLPVAPYADRRTVRQDVTLYMPLGASLFTLPQPVAIDIPARADFTSIATGDQTRADVSRLLTLQRLREGDTYTVRSSISDADIQSLRAAGTVYPDWATARYLQLPETLPPEVAATAAEVVQRANATTPYDQVAALEAWLRTTYTYNDQIPAPAPDQDGVAYFLFDVQQGYCDYYAASLAVMARTLGIPARIATGYAQGEYDPNLEAFRVRERDADTWVEVFFPTYGWVEFEPTAAQPSIERVEGEEATEPPTTTETTEEPTIEPPPLDEFTDPLLDTPQTPLDLNDPTDDLTRAARTVAPILAVVGLGAAAYIMLSRWRRQRLMEDPGLVEKVFDQLSRWAGRIGFYWPNHYTPRAEGAQRMVTLVPEGSSSIRRITDLYVRQRWDQKPLEVRDAAHAVDAWDELQPVLRRHWLRRRFTLRRRSRD